MRSGLNSRHLFIALFFIVALLHCYTLDLFPLPWFDEVHFGGISKSLSEDGSLKSHFLSFTKGNDNSLSYGPVFFAIQSVFIKIFGFTMFSVRIVTLLFGCVNIILVFIIGLRVTDSRFTASLVSVAFLFDLFYSTTLHEGRMETLITSLFLIAILVIMSDVIKDFVKVLLTSLICVICFSTSPRSFIFIIPLVVYLMYNNSKRHLNMLALFVAVFVGVYSMWVFMAFNSIEHWFYHYLDVIKGNKTAIHGYLGGNFYIPLSQYALIATVLVLIFINRRGIQKPLTFLMYACILMFYSLIHDWGNYSSLIIPLYYLLLVFLLNELVDKKKIILFLAPLLIFNIFYFSLKIGSVLLEKDIRSSDVVESKLIKHIRPNSKVIGDDLIIYIAENQKWNFQVFNHYKSLEEREKNLRENFDYEYLLVSKQFHLKERKQVDYFIGQNQLKLVDKFESHSHSINAFLEKVGLSAMEKTGYSYFLYGR